MDSPAAPLIIEALSSSRAAVSLLAQLGFWTVGAMLGLFFYGLFFNGIIFDARGRVRTRLLDYRDAVVAAILSGFFFLLAGQSVHRGGGETTEFDANQIVAATGAVAFVFLVLVGTILLALWLRRISWREVFGFTRLGLPAVVGWAILLLALAYPLVYMTSLVSEVVLSAVGDAEDQKQSLVNFFMHSSNEPAKWIVAFSAVVLAPMYEDFIFRGYLYGVAKRFGGTIFGIVFNSVLFALIHGHLPSLAPLFVLAVCLTLAYEWTGSLWVPICMHSLFNSITVIQLLFDPSAR